MPFGSIKPDSYYDRTQRPGASLLRARKPYLFKNAFTGLAIFGFACGVYVYTIKAVGMDDFDDVKPAIPNEHHQTQYRESA